jgi:hypothetical protein
LTDPSIITTCLLHLHHPLHLHLFFISIILHRCREPLAFSFHPHPHQVKHHTTLGVKSIKSNPISPTTPLPIPELHGQSPTPVAMSSYSRRNDANESYLMNSQLVPGVPYNHPEPHDFNSSAASYHFPPQSFANPYNAASQFAGAGGGGGPTYGHQPTLTAQGMQHLQYASDHTIPSMSTNEDMKFHHPHAHGHGHGNSHSHSHSQYMAAQSRYMQSPRYLPLREAFETEIENQESRNEGTMLSEAVIPALNGFPDVKEFDQLIQRYELMGSVGMMIICACACANRVHLFFNWYNTWEISGPLLIWFNLPH